MARERANCIALAKGSGSESLPRQSIAGHLGSDGSFDSKDSSCLESKSEAECMNGTFVRGAKNSGPPVGNSVTQMPEVTSVEGHNNMRACQCGNRTHDLTEISAQKDRGNRSTATYCRGCLICIDTRQSPGVPLIREQYICQANYITYFWILQFSFGGCSGAVEPHSFISSRK